MADIPESGRAAAHALIDAVTGFEVGSSDDRNALAMNTALQRLDEIPGAVTAARDDKTGAITVDVSNLTGGAIVSINWLVRQLASDRDVSPEVVIAELREFLDA